MHPPDWAVVRLGQIAVKIGSGATPSGGQGSYLSRRQKYALIRSQNVFDHRFDPVGLAFISNEQASRLQGAMVQADDLLLNITGDGVTFARACAVSGEVLPACVNQHVSIIRVKKEMATPGYVLAYLTHPGVKHYMESFNAGGSRRALTKGHIESFEIPLPPFSQQVAIAHILGTLNEKVELNRQLSETLEEMARVLFKSWFVDFEPVRANLENRDASLPKPLADLFPTCAVDSELGEIPEGWSVGEFGQLAEHLRDTAKPHLESEAEFLHFSLPAYDDGQQPRLETGAKIKSNKWRVSTDTVLLSKLNPEIERVWMVDVEQGDRAICSTEFLVLSAVPPIGTSYLYCLCKSVPFRNVLGGLVTGTSKSHQRAQVGAIMRIPVVVPSVDILEAFERMVSPMLDRALTYRRESTSLAAIRDTLLPKLISGEFRVPDAERCVSEVI